MNDEHESVLAAIDAYHRLIRSKAADDPVFAKTLLSALGVPVNLHIEQKDLAQNLPFVDPIPVARKGEAHFRETFRHLTDANVKKILKHFNLADTKPLTAKNGYKGEALFAEFWKAAEGAARR